MKKNKLENDKKKYIIKVGNQKNKVQGVKTKEKRD